MPAMAAPIKALHASTTLSIDAGGCTQVNFQAAHTLAAVRVAAVTATADGQPVRYASKSVLLTDDYHVA